MKLLKYWLPPILWGLIIFSFSSLQVGSSNEIYWKDFVIKKTAHVVEYAILAVLLYRAMIGSDVEKKKAIIFSMLIVSLYGFTDEFHQSFTPGREPRIRDVIIDTIGGALGVLTFCKVLEKYPKWKEKFL
ncbi:MAG TPA: VanZ family protein [Patescibacteria group bacterium]|nr:VanZ family protein [Patescibacteria group bacterium]